MQDVAGGISQRFARLLVGIQQQLVCLVRGGCRLNNGIRQRLARVLIKGAQHPQAGLNALGIITQNGRTSTIDNACHILTKRVELVSNEVELVGNRKHTGKSRNLITTRHVPHLVGVRIHAGNRVVEVSQSCVYCLDHIFTLIFFHIGKPVRCRWLRRGIHSHAARAHKTLAPRAETRVKQRFNSHRGRYRCSNSPAGARNRSTSRHKGTASAQAARNTHGCASSALSGYLASLLGRLLACLLCSLLGTLLAQLLSSLLSYLLLGFLRALARNGRCTLAHGSARLAAALGHLVGKFAVSARVQIAVVLTMTALRIVTRGFTQLLRGGISSRTLGHSAV